MANENIFRYWGKADLNYPGEPKWHPLVYHCLDVAAVAAEWWDRSRMVRLLFQRAFGFEAYEEKQLRAWLLFFISLHDIGKMDARFQLKAPDVLNEIWPDLDAADVDLTDYKGHGGARVIASKEFNPQPSQGQSLVFTLTANPVKTSRASFA